MGLVGLVGLVGPGVTMMKSDGRSMTPRAAEKVDPRAWECGRDRADSPPALKYSACVFPSATPRPLSLAEPRAPKTALSRLKTRSRRTLSGLLRLHQGGSRRRALSPCAAGSAHHLLPEQLHPAAGGICPRRVG